MSRYDREQRPNYRQPHKVRGVVAPNPYLVASLAEKQHSRQKHQALNGNNRTSNGNGDIGQGARESDHFKRYHPDRRKHHGKE